MAMAQQYPFHDNTFEQDNQAIREALAAIGQKYDVTQVTEEEEATIQQQLSQFDSFQSYQEVFLYGSARINQGDTTSYFTVVSLNYQQETLTAYQVQQSGLTEFTYVGLTRLNKDYGTVFIRPETTTEWVIEWFYPTNVRFEADKDFSKHYRVIADDEALLKEQVTGEFLALIQQYDELSIEIKGKNMMVRFPKGLSVEVAEGIADFLVGVKG